MRSIVVIWEAIPLLIFVFLHSRLFVSFSRFLIWFEGPAANGCALCLLSCQQHLNYCLRRPASTPSLWSSSAVTPWSLMHRSLPLAALRCHHHHSPPAWPCWFQTNPWLSSASALPSSAAAAAPRSSGECLGKQQASACPHLRCQPQRSSSNLEGCHQPSFFTFFES